MAAGWILATGIALLALGAASRCPWGRWWSGGGELSEQAATLLFPAGGVLLTAVGLGMMAESHGAPGAVVTLLGVVAIVGLLAGIWVIFSLPVPDRLLVEGSEIRSARARRRTRRARRKESR